MSFYSPGPVKRPAGHRLVTQRYARLLYPEREEGRPPPKLPPPSPVKEKDVPLDRLVGMGPVSFFAEYVGRRKKANALLSHGCSVGLDYRFELDSTFPQWGELARCLLPSDLGYPQDDDPNQIYPREARFRFDQLREGVPTYVVRMEEYIDTVQVRWEDWHANPAQVEEDLMDTLLFTDLRNPDVLLAKLLLRFCEEHQCQRRSDLPEALRAVLEDKDVGHATVIVPPSLVPAVDALYLREWSSSRRVVVMDELDEYLPEGARPAWFVQDTARGPETLLYSLGKSSMPALLRSPDWEPESPWMYFGWYKAEGVGIGDASKLYWGH